MKTITFYSYKGGVGRSLALSNIAIRLSQFGKKVCIIDFDLDAPGLRFKFKSYNLEKKIEKGIVDYIFEFSNLGTIPSQISDYVVQLFPRNHNFSPISFISAGDIESNEYWKKLSMIKWADMFYSEKPTGIRFFLDLKAKIEKEINPDVLLIDSRTGITDISGITLRIFADEIVVLAANNDENIFGCKKIIKSLRNNENTLFKKIPKINFVLTRLPFTDTPQDKQKEIMIIDKQKKIFNTLLNISNFQVSVIHSDRRLEEEEKHLIGYNYDKQVSISNDYLKLFDLLTVDLLSTDEVNSFNNLKQAESEFANSINEKDLAKKLIFINNAIKLNDQQFGFYLERGNIYWNLQDYEKALDDYEKALKLSPNNDQINFGIGVLNMNLKFYDKAIEYLDKIKTYQNNALIYKASVFKLQGKIKEAVKLLDTVLINNPNDDFALNSRADTLRVVGNYKKAYSDVYKAIELNQDEPIYIATLAEINAEEGNIDGFYLNLSLALSKGLIAKAMNGVKEVYEKFKNETRFLTLMSKYNINVEEIFSND